MFVVDGATHLSFCTVTKEEPYSYCPKKINLVFLTWCGCAKILHLTWTISFLYIAILSLNIQLCSTIHAPSNANEKMFVFPRSVKKFDHKRLKSERLLPKKWQSRDSHGMVMEDVVCWYLNTMINFRSMLEILTEEERQYIIVGISRSSRR